MELISPVPCSNVTHVHCSDLPLALWQNNLSKPPLSLLLFPECSKYSKPPALLLWVQYILKERMYSGRETRCLLIRDQLEQVSGNESGTFSCCLGRAESLSPFIKLCVKENISESLSEVVDVATQLPPKPG